MTGFCTTSTTRDRRKEGREEKSIVFHEYSLDHHGNIRLVQYGLVPPNFT